MTTKKTAKRKKATKRETSDRVSRIAGTVLARLRGLPAKTELSSGDWELPLAWVTVGEARALAASCLVQDVTKGPRKAKGRGK